MKKIFSMLLMLCFFVACSDSDDEVRSLVLDQGTPTQQTVYADQTSGAQGISFYAASPWTAEVVAVAREKVDWIELSQYSGGEGNFTLTLKIKKNDTGADRKAQIVITTGDTKIVITVEQKAQTKDEAEGGQPDVPTISRQVVKISCFDDVDGKREMRWFETYTYDSDNRLSGKTYKSYDLGEIKSFDEITYSYSKNAKGQTIVRSLTEEKASSYNETSTEELTVDESGRAVSAWSAYGNSSDKAYTDYRYDDKGRLVYTTTVGEDDNNFTTSWTADDITKVVWSYQNETTQLQYNKNVLNNASVDLLHIICFRDLGSEGLAFNRGNLDEVCNLDFFGPRGMHMASRISTIDDKGQSVKYDIEYKLDAKQRIVEVDVSESFDNQSAQNDRIIYTMEYK